LADNLVCEVFSIGEGALVYLAVKFQKKRIEAKLIEGPLFLKLALVHGEFALTKNLWEQI